MLPKAAGTVAPPRYWAAVAITVGAILSQYFLPQLVPALRPAYASLPAALFVVYGVPILAFALLVGAGPIRGWAGRNGRAFDVGLRAYGVLTLLALVASVFLLALILFVDPAARGVLTASTPVVRTAEADPYFWALLSFPIGVVEELIFRGWIFGYWLQRDPTRWKLHVLWTSGLFAAMHLYYALTYGVVFVIPALVLVTDGAAFAITFRESGGNLIAISFLHGWNDATVFIALALPVVGYALHYALVLLGVALAVAVHYRRQLLREASAGPLLGS
ncbi:MAG: CPBP family glutamic-type intramembrane protease [Thermoplasmata archaeon]